MARDHGHLSAVFRYLGDHNVAVRRPPSFDEVVQDVLRNLRGFAAACGSSDDHHRVALQGPHDLVLKLFDGQLIALCQDLNNTASVRVQSTA